MEKDTLLPFAFPAVARKKVTAAFDGGMLSSDAGVLLLRNVEKKLGIAQRLSGCLKDKRDRDLITHTVEEMLRLAEQGINEIIALQREMVAVPPPFRSPVPPSR